MKLLTSARRRRGSATIEVALGPATDDPRYLARAARIRSELRHAEEARCHEELMQRASLMFAEANGEAAADVIARWEKKRAGKALVNVLSALLCGVAGAAAYSEGSRWFALGAWALACFFLFAQPRRLDP